MTTATPTTPCRAPVEEIGRCVICQLIAVTRICRFHWHRPLCGCDHAYNDEYAAMLTALDSQQQAIRIRR